MNHSFFVLGHLSSWVLLSMLVEVLLCPFSYCLSSAVFVCLCLLLLNKRLSPLLSLILCFVHLSWNEACLLNTCPPFDVHVMFWIDPDSLHNTHLRQLCHQCQHQHSLIHNKVYHIAPLPAPPPQPSVGSSIHALGMVSVNAQMDVFMSAK